MHGIGAIHYIFLLFSVLVIFVYAPVENENKPISEKRKVLFHKISRGAVVIIALVSCLVYIHTLTIPIKHSISLPKLLLHVTSIVAIQAFRFHLPKLLLEKLS